jgi:hypothetical protein
MTPKKIDFKSGSFVANGKDYFITNKISIGRKRMLDQIKVRLGTEMSVNEIWKFLANIDKELIADRSPIHNIVESRQLTLNAMVKVKEMIDNDYDPYLHFAALFINTKDEDIREISTEQIITKINDWKEDGYDYDDFFFFATNSVHGLQNHYIELSQKANQ